MRLPWPRVAHMQRNKVVFDNQAALTEALMRGDVEAVETLLRFGDPTGIALVCAGRLAVALSQLDNADAAAVLTGWREMGDSGRGALGG